MAVNDSLEKNREQPYLQQTFSWYSTKMQQDTMLEPHKSPELKVSGSGTTAVNGSLKK